MLTFHHTLELKAIHDILCGGLSQNILQSSVDGMQPLFQVTYWKEESDLGLQD
jgi:hypothetical protein